MTVLHLGVIDVPYAQSSYRPPAKKAKGFRRGKALRGDAGAAASPTAFKTTGDVAEILEAKYHIMEVFFEDVSGDAIGDALAHSVAGAIENLFAGAPPASIAPTAEAEGEIESAFRHYLAQEEMAALGIPGVPTGAALRGVNHRRIHPYAKGNAPRPSFIDTGLYMANFKAWVDG